MALGFGSDGHRIVGAIADEKLAGTPTEEKVKELLDGIKLTEAAVIPDQIRRWDKDGPDRPHSFHLDGHPELEKQLVAFWKANPPETSPRKTDDSDPVPSHAWFHYTDVPVFSQVKYSDGKTGRSRWDVVHMIRYCVRVLQGKESDQNSRGITKPVALILLAHYVGDIHQPLHVGAEYFDRSGRPCDPDTPPVPGTPPPEIYEDMGGNSLLLTLKIPLPLDEYGKRTRLHSYWDVRTVKTAWTLWQNQLRNPSAPPGTNPSSSEILQYLADTEPAHWKIKSDSDPEEWAEAWANSILPLAWEAHQRLDFEDMVCRVEHGALVAYGSAVEGKSPDGEDYETWSGQAVRDSLHRAGWRLADLLTQVLQP